MKQALLSAVGLQPVDPDWEFVLRTDASNYAIGAVLEQVLDVRRHVPVASRTRVLAEGQSWTWTPHEKEVYAIVMALREWVRYGLHRPSESAVVAQGARGRPLRTSLPWSEMARDLGQVRSHGGLRSGKRHHRGGLSQQVPPPPASKGMSDVSAVGDEAEIAKAKKIIHMECMKQKGGVK